MMSSGIDNSPKCVYMYGRASTYIKQNLTELRRATNPQS